MAKKKVLSVVLALTALGTTACGTPPGASVGNKPDDVTILQVYNYDGGIGTQWLHNIKPKFEEAYKDYSFETNKKGVMLEVIPGKSDVSTIVAAGYHVAFTEEVVYNDLAAQGKILDISDVVTTSLSGVTGGVESGTIEDKLDASQQEALKAKDGKYYVLPHYEIYTGLVYDADLFTEKAFYFARGGGWTDEDSEKSCGPDGIYNTYDDGLPSSYEEFYKMMDKMVDESVAPFVFAGQLPNYMNDLLIGLWSAYTGKDEFLLNVNFDSQGTGTNARIMEFEGDTPVEKEVAITQENGYLLSQQSGKYYAYEFLSKILSKSDYMSEKVTGSLAHTGAQEQFIYSNLEGKTNPIAMLIEGSYWYNEAGDYIRRSENTYKDKAKNRNFAWMPLPRQITGSVKEGEGTKNAVLETLSSFSFINASIKDNAGLLSCAKTFLQYCYTDESLANFTMDTGTPKGVQYTLSNDQMAALPNYQRSLMEIKANSDVIYPYSAHKIFVNAQAKFDYDQGSQVWQSKVGNKPYLVPYYAMKDDKVTAKNYFQGSATAKDVWDNLYSKYFND